MSSSSESALAGVVARSITHRNGLYLGARAGEMLFAPSERGMLVLGPPRTGKTTSIVIPNVIAAAGSVVVVSTKRDVLDTTLPPRHAFGACWLFDLGGLDDIGTAINRVGWTPLQSARDWDRAVLVAEAMVGAGQRGHPGESTHWTERAGALLATLFHAAALEGLAMADLVSVVNRREPEPLLATLARGESLVALDLLMGILGTDQREQSGIWSTASSVLAAYRTTAALASAAVAGIDADRFVRGQETLYIVASSEQQLHVAPIIVGILRDLRAATYAAHRATHANTTQEAASRNRSGALGAPLLMVLDELANIAPLHDLPTLVAEGASQGVLTLACLQDLSQARMRWGVAAEGFMSLFGAKVILEGIGDTRTLEAVSRLAGDHDVRTISHSTTLRARVLTGRSSRTVGHRRDRRLPLDAIAQVRPHHAVVLIGATPHWIRITPWFENSPWKEAVASP